jgi:exodeoxyribonuclease V alpha subunit
MPPGRRHPCPPRRAAFSGARRGEHRALPSAVPTLLQRDPDLRVALAAPTGKAAARLAESVSEGVQALGLHADLARRIPAVGRTLHRLLGYRPWDDRFGHGADEPLGEDVVIVDEASMVDVLMMDALFAALRPDARIILLGDQDQLASVDTGFVLGDVCRAAERCGSSHGTGLGEWVRELGGQEIECARHVSPMRDMVIRLQRSYRFERQPGIGALADSIRRGDAQAAAGVLADTACADVGIRSETSTPGVLETIGALLDEYRHAAGPEEALDRFAAFRVLCAVREGRTGVAGLNERIEGWLRTRGLQTRTRWYDRRPVLVTSNDPASGLYNGDVGVTLVENGYPRVWFRDGAGRPRAVAPARLPAHETAWAMTVHKAQGSEFTHVVFVLPEDDVQVLTRELLYTAVTRARSRVDIVGTMEQLARGIGRTTRRASGLCDRLLP